MKAPDKLYVGRRNYGPLIGGWKSQPFTSKEIESIEYIRKEALMEWLNQMLEISAQSLEFQRNYAYGKVIDKLNSM